MSLSKTQLLHGLMAVIFGLSCLVESAWAGDGNQAKPGPRIPYRQDGPELGPEEVVKAIRARRPGGKLQNLDRVLLYSPAFARGWNSMFGAIRGELSLPPKLRELVIMAVGVLNHADYEYIQHRPEFLAAGGSEEQLKALGDVAAARDNTRLFADDERAALALAYEMTCHVAVTDSTMASLRKLLPDQQVVELAGTIAGYNMVSRFLVAFGIEP